MAWSDDRSLGALSPSSSLPKEATAVAAASVETKFNEFCGAITSCSSCGNRLMSLQDNQELPGLPAGVKFDPTDLEILEHLEAKVQGASRKLHPLLDEFIPTLRGENGICYTHPENLPGVSKDGIIRHFFHRPSKAYTTGTRKRRKVQIDHDQEGGAETRWHKTGKTRAVVENGAVKGFKKILVLYTNYGRQKKPEKTSWVMHQYHLGDNEDEKDGELVASKVFYQTHPRQCGSSTTGTIKEILTPLDDHEQQSTGGINIASSIKYYHERNTDPLVLQFDHEQNM